jgi:flagellar motility protein MotE (MotC chaperone)
MNARAVVKHIRLLPAVMMLGTALLVMKGEGLLAAPAETGKSHPAAPQTSSASDPASDATESGSASAVDVLTSLSRRRAELDTRERNLTTRENLIAAAAKRVDERISELKGLQAQLQTLLGQRDTAEQKQFDQLVKSYTAMRPKDSARIFNALSDDVLVPVAAAMKPDVLGAVLAQMTPDQAQKLTLKLAERLKLKQLEAPPTQVASVAPAAVPGQASTVPAPTSANPSGTQTAAAAAPLSAAPAQIPTATPGASTSPAPNTPAAAAPSPTNK